MHNHPASMETYNGCVRTPADAIKLFEACRLGLLPRVQRRLSEKERQSIRPGSVFVWDEREAGMRRWTDGKSWSASRVSGSFLTYREMEGKRGSGFGTARRTTAGRSPESGRMSDDDQEGEPEGYRYKTDGLMKQSFSITTSQGQHLHLISYYARPLPGGPELVQPTADPSLRHITPNKSMYPESSLHDANPPALTRTPMQSYNSPASQDQGTYGTQWASPAWMGVSAWTHSPNQVPPYPYGKPEPEMALQAHPPPQSRRAPQLPLSSPPNQSPLYERLPPPAAYQIADRHSSRSPRSQHLQVQAAQAVMINPRMPTSARNSQGPLATIGITPSPPRPKSISPPHTSSSISSGDIAARKASLSSILLHPAPSSSEPNSANPANNNSASSSPGALAAAPHDMSADRQALRSLDRKFCH
ncbi:Gti1/Pac2 family-domain-containing protein [Xylaria telfairii]|nr:Gti1/Pac2 family-domain-containing protein [Xylaria telfairii]